MPEIKNHNVYVSSFAYCKNFNTSQNVNENESNVTLIPFLNINSLHHGAALYAVCSIVGIHSFDNDSIYVYFKAPDDSILLQYDWTLDSRLLNNIGGKIPDAIVFNIAISCNIQDTGFYSTEVFFNNLRIGNFKINVISRDI